MAQCAVLPSQRSQPGHLARDQFERLRAGQRIKFPDKQGIYREFDRNWAVSANSGVKNAPSFKRLGTKFPALMEQGLRATEQGIITQEQGILQPDVGKECCPGENSSSLFPLENGSG